MIDIPVLSGEVVNLGRVGENQARRVIFDITDWNAEYPGATIALLNEPPGATDAYPVPNVTVDGDNVYWIIGSADVPKYGCGRCELIATQDEVIVKSEIYGTVTQRALDDTGTAPEPWESWQTVFAGLKDEAVSAAENAEAASEAVQDMGVEAETLEPGSAATVIKTVDPDTGAVTLNFGVPAGESGQTPDLTIGTVSTLPAGSDATATITGTPEEPVLNLGIPQGEKGDSGEGVPTGGTTGQMLVKATDADYDAEWVDPPEGEVTQDEFDALKQYVYDMSPVTTVTAPVVSVSDAAPLNAEDVFFEVEPVQEGSGDPSPDNVRLITGWTGAEVSRTGKNLLPQKKNQYTATQVRLGSETADEAYMTLKAGTYTLSLQANVSVTCYYRAYNGNAVTIGQNGGTFTLSEDTFLVIYCYKSGSLSADDITRWQLELGSTATDYEPYQSDTFDITFPTEAGTVYGGTVDVTTGVLTVDRVSKLLNDPTKWSTISSNTVNFICYEDCSNRRKTAESFSGLICSYMSVNSSSPENTARWVGATSNNFGIKSGTLTIEQIKADAADGRIMICYPLATPITYDLTPQEIEMFKGWNNLWANTGDISVQYRQDVYTALNNKINALEALVLENLN